MKKGYKHRQASRLADLLAFKKVVQYLLPKTCIFIFLENKLLLHMGKTFSKFSTYSCPNSYPSILGQS